MTGHVLHVEDDPNLALLVRVALEKFGFRGKVHTAATVSEALDILREWRTAGEPLQLVLVDVQLPDGSGLDVLRELRRDDAWARVPAVVLSGERDPRVIDEAYALGAAAYLDKCPEGSYPIDVVENVYRCWLDHPAAAAPGPESAARPLLARASTLEARVSELYTGLARAFAEDPALLRFWMEMALAESNHANLLAFFQGLGRNTDVAAERLTRLREHLEEAEACVTEVAEMSRLRPRPTLDEALGWAARIEGCPSEELLSEGLAILGAVERVAASLLAENMARHVEDFVSGALRLTRNPAVRGEITALHDRAAQIRSPHPPE